MGSLESDGLSPSPCRRRTGILVHGYNLQADGWESVAWGKPPDCAGRVPVGVFMALLEQAEVLAFGSGASSKNGLLESEATIRLMRERFAELADFSIFQHYLPEIGKPERAERYRQQIESILHVDTESRNTREEITNAGKMFVERDVERVILVSSPTHLPRCLRDACAIFEANEALGSLLSDLHAVPSVTGYTGYSAADVTIFEPPHRPDRSDVNLGGVLARVHHIPESRQGPFIQRLDELLSEFEA